MVDVSKMPNIKGWGADLDTKNRPAYPKERSPARFINPHWEEIEHQPQRIRIFHSIEHTESPAIFGTSVPPSGLSGWIRERAYRLAESKIQRWMLLLLADRINVIEGVAQDLKQGKLPDIFSEMGLKSELKHNRAQFTKKVAIGAAVILALGFYLGTRRSRS